MDGELKTLLVHRKGATRAFPPHHPLIPVDYQFIGQPVIVGGTMGTCSYVLTGTQTGMAETFGSTCHGAGRAKSRNQARCDGLSAGWRNSLLINQSLWGGGCLRRRRGHVFFFRPGSDYLVGEMLPGRPQDVRFWVCGEGSKRLGGARVVIRDFLWLLSLETCRRFLCTTLQDSGLTTTDFQPVKSLADSYRACSTFCRAPAIVA